MSKIKGMEKLSVQMDNIESLTNKGGEIKVLISPKTVNSKQLIFGAVILKPSEELIEHVHDYGEEAMFVKSGIGYAYINDQKVTLLPDTAVLVPQNSRHWLVNTGTENLEIIFAAAPLAPNAKAGDRII